MRRRVVAFFLFFFNDTATTEIYTLSLHDALPISHTQFLGEGESMTVVGVGLLTIQGMTMRGDLPKEAEGIGQHLLPSRSEEHTSELQSRPHLVCRLLLEKKKHHTQ